MHKRFPKLNHGHNEHQHRKGLPVLLFIARDSKTIATKQGTLQMGEMNLIESHNIGLSLIQYPSKEPHCTPQCLHKKVMDI